METFFLPTVIYKMDMLLRVLHVQWRLRKLQEKRERMSRKQPCLSLQVAHNNFELNSVTNTVYIPYAWYMFKLPIITGKIM